MYKLILLNYCMQDIEGPIVAATILDLIHGQNLPAPYICCCSEYDSREYKSKAMSSGMDIFLIKPITAIMLNDVL